jgi:2-oxoglutarate dehydrogenase E2 component (dihydrolipoamide succinyltransferase)
MIEIVIPSIAETINEVEIGSWLVKDGDFVLKDKEIAEVETDKATIPLVAAESGIISIKIDVGKVIPIGTIVATIDNSVKGESKTIETPMQAVIPSPQPGPSVPEKDLSAAIKITPLAKKMMEENKMDTNDILQGLHRITSSEVKKVLQSGSTSIKEDLKENRVVSRQRMSMFRRNLSKRLLVARNETAMLTTFNEVDLTEVIQIRSQYQPLFQKAHTIKLGYMSFFTKACTIALQQFPMVNSMIDGEDIVTPSYCDIGIAVQTEKGLMVPVMRNAESMNMALMEAKIKELADKARTNKISIDELTGGTFSITNGGIFGSMMSTPLLNPPQSAILGMHNIIERPIVKDGQIVAHPMMYIALSYDHRVIDGKDSVSFLATVKNILEHPSELLFGKEGITKELGIE